MLPLTLSTCNIRFAGSPDDIGDRQWERRRGAVVASIRRDPSLLVIGLQEALRRQFDDVLWLLNEAAGREEWVGVFAGREDGKGGGEACAVMWKKDALFCEKTATFWLSLTPDAPGSRAPSTRLPRICTACLFKDTRPGSSGRHFLLFNAHLDHENPRSRALGIDVILNRAREMGKDLPGAPVFILGDFNSVPSEAEVHGRLKGAGFSDLSPTSAATFHGWTGVGQQRIDFIYCGSGDRAIEVEQFLVDASRYASSPGTAEAVLPSDHFLVIARVSFSST